MPLSRRPGERVTQASGRSEGLGGAFGGRKLRLPQALHPWALMTPLLAILKADLSPAPPSRGSEEPGRLPVAVPRMLTGHLGPMASLLSSCSGTWGLALTAGSDLAVPLMSRIL